MNDNYGDFVPYEVKENGKINKNRNQNVRNLGTIYDYLYFCNKVDREVKIKGKIDKDIEYYEMKYKNGSNMEQASIFLFLILYFYYGKKNIKNKINEKNINKIWLQLYQIKRPCQVNYRLDYHLAYLLLHQER